jgi:hypothetical protein
LVAAFVGAMVRAPVREVMKTTLDSMEPELTPRLSCRSHRHRRRGAASQTSTGNCYSNFPLKTVRSNSRAGPGEFAEDSASWVVSKCDELVDVARRHPPTSGAGVGDWDVRALPGYRTVKAPLTFTI